ncbi:MAG: Chemotaxis protein CheA [Fimbriimonadaceae bacterium]|nr:Chemotaxis protein CheA [Fimbriimonadaceae bacterium]
MSIDITSFHQAFFEEATELLDGFENHLLQLESSPNDRELLNSIFRCAHSIKGGSATFGFPEIATFTHSLETLLDGVRNGEIAVSKPLCTLLLESLDQMRALLAVAKGDQADAPASDDLIARIEEATTSHGTEEGFGDSNRGMPQIFELTFTPGDHCLPDGPDPLAAVSELHKLGDVLSIDCDSSAVPALAELDPSKCYLSWRIMLHTDSDADAILAHFSPFEPAQTVRIYLLGGQQVLDDSPTAVTESQASGAVQPNSQKDTGTIKVSAEKLDGLINLVGELVISQSMLNMVTRDFHMGKMPQLTEAVASMERSSRELQERVMGMRLLQIKMAFGRFPRLVHDLSTAVGKRIELKLVGEETELDKNLIEAIGDPLTHLVRNSIDHGLETPEERRSAGKPEAGVLSISAFHEGGNIVIEVADDGKGLNRDKILAKAIDRGLVSPDENLSDEHVYNLIFQPGFSTADKITDLSGRGVGMDIVKQAISAIGGTVKIVSSPGKGVSTRIRLPLTMAILEGQSMSVGDGVYIVPLTSILESIRPRQEDIHTVAQLGEVVTVRGEYLPVLRLHHAFGVAPVHQELWEGALVLIESDGRKVALFADELIGQGQVVIKSLETNYRKVDGIAGATILGDGRVALIVDVPGLTRGMNLGLGALQAAA